MRGCWCWKDGGLTRACWELGHEGAGHSVLHPARVTRSCPVKMTRSWGRVSRVLPRAPRGQGVGRVAVRGDRGRAPSAQQLAVTPWTENTIRTSRLKPRHAWDWWANRKSWMLKFCRDSGIDMKCQHNDRKSQNIQTHLKILFLPRAAEAANYCCRAAWSALCPAVSCCWCCCCTAVGCWAAGAAVGARPGTARPGRMPRLLRITLLPSSAAVLAACTTSLGWAFLHSTCSKKMSSELGCVSLLNVSLTFLFLMVWKWISQTLSTASSCSKVTNPKPRCLLVCWSINMTASSTLPATRGH